MHTKAICTVAFLTLNAVFAVGELSQEYSEPWLDSRLPPERRARILVNQMTSEEKRSMLYGTKGSDYVGYVPAISRLNIPALKYNDGPQGFRDDSMLGSTTAWPSGLTVAASWDTNTMRAWGESMGKEFFDKGANVQLGPGVCVARIPKNGRNFEYLSGEDPYLGYVLVQPVVKAIQGQQVVANAKHYVNNNQETNRHFVSENVDERTRFEMYYPPFVGAIESGVGSAMCSYNKINQVWSCENNSTLMRDLKIRMKYRGYVMSDWGATHSLSIEKGLDQEMPGNTSFNQQSLKSIPENVIDDSVVRIFTPFFEVGTFDNPNPNQISNNVTSVEHVAIARELSENSTILLKNDGNVLPLKKTNLKVAVVGTQAWNPIVHGGGSGRVIASWVKPPLWSLCDMLGVDRVDNTTSESSKCNQKNGNCVTYFDGTENPPPSAAADYDVALLFVQTSSSEGYDRTNLTFGAEQENMLVKWSHVTGKGFKKVLIMSTPGAVLTPWSDNIHSILLNFMPGEAMGDAISNLIFGDVVPTGKLPLTFPNKDNEQEMTVAQYPGVDNAGNATYTEGFFFGYRWYDKHKVTPKYSFGHGLSYTTFAYGKIIIEGRTVSCDITNTGLVRGAEVVQLYVGFGDQRFGKDQREETVKQLKGFGKYYLNPSETVRATFVLKDRDLSYWDIENTRWALKVGKAEVSIGSSSTDIRATGTINVN
eukprot:g11241.t1